jgi:DNA polymerase III gamma/tau subunit
MLNTGQTCTQILDTLIDFMRDLMVIKSTDEKSSLLILTNRERERMAALAPKFDIPAIIYNITTLEKLRWTIKNSDNPRALLEAALLRLALAEHFLSVPQLLDRLKKGGTATNPVKKKSNHPATINRPAQSVAQPESPVPPSLPAPQNWTDLLAAAKQRDARTAGLLEAADEPPTINGKTLTITFPKTNEFAKAMCENKSEIISSLISDILARQVTLKFETTSEPNQSTSPADSISEKDKALNDPAVKTLLSGLNATVTHIEEVKEN